MKENVLNKSFGCQNMTDPIRSVIVKHPENAYISQSDVDEQAPKLNYFGTPKFDDALNDFNKFIDLLISFGSEIHFLPKNNNTALDSIYTRDTSIITDRGAIICNMGKKDRIKEPVAISKYLESINIPIIGEIKDPGTLEGGDVVWIDESTIAIGEGYRTNSNAIEQLKKLLNQNIEIISVPLPHWTGPEDCLHLMSNLSPIREKLFLVYPKLLPVRFIKYLNEREIKLIDVPDEEYQSMGCNVLALDSNTAIMVEGNPITKSRLESEGIKVLTYPGNEISVKGTGGPTCLTRPLLRTK